MCSLLAGKWRLSSTPPASMATPRSTWRCWGCSTNPPDAFFEAYGPLAPGASERLPIYRLWPALVHLRLFGPSYRGMVEGFLHQAGV